MVIYTLENFKFAFDFMETLKDIKEDNKNHLESDVFNHSLQVLQLAFKESNDIGLIISAMLHDIGKSRFIIDHDKIAVDLLRDYVSVKTLWLIEHHIRIRYLLEGKIKKLMKVKYLINHLWLPELILLTRWDKSGRIPNKVMEYDKEYILDRLNQCAEKHFKNTIIVCDKCNLNHIQGESDNLK